MLPRTPYEKSPMWSCHPISNSRPVLLMLPAFTGDAALPTTVEGVIPVTMRSLVFLRNQSALNERRLFKKRESIPKLVCSEVSHLSSLLPVAEGAYPSMYSVPLPVG